MSMNMHSAWQPGQQQGVQHQEGSTHGDDVPYIYGSIVMTRSGVPMWSGWVSKPREPIPTKQLCKTIADVFRGDSEAQDSSYLDAGTFVVASTADAAYIVSVICTPATPETEVLLKARELSHAVKLLFGPQVGVLASVAPSELAELLSKTTLLQMLQISNEVDDEQGTRMAPETQEWLAEHAHNRTLHEFFMSKLTTTSPVQVAFEVMEGCPGFVGAHFVDLTEPGEVLLSHWHEPDSGGHSTSGGGIPSGEGTVQRSISQDIAAVLGGGGGGRGSRAGGGHRQSTVLDALHRHEGGVWTMVMREARNLASVAAAGGSGHISRRYARRDAGGVGSPSPSPRGGGAAGVPQTATIDLGSSEQGMQVTIALLRLQHYEAAFVLVYEVGPGMGLAHGAGTPRGATAFHVSHEESAAHPAVAAALDIACADVRARFPLTRDQLLQLVWPQIPVPAGTPTTPGAPAAAPPPAPASTPQTVERPAVRTAAQHVHGVQSQPVADRREKLLAELGLDSHEWEGLSEASEEASAVEEEEQASGSDHSSGMAAALGLTSPAASAVQVQQQAQGHRQQGAGGRVPRATNQNSGAPPMRKDSSGELEFTSFKYAAGNSTPVAPAPTAAVSAPPTAAQPVHAPLQLQSPQRTDAVTRAGPTAARGAGVGTGFGAKGVESPLLALQRAHPASKAAAWAARAAAAMEGLSTSQHGTPTGVGSPGGSFSAAGPASAADAVKAGAPAVPVQASRRVSSSSSSSSSSSTSSSDDPWAGTAYPKGRRQLLPSNIGSAAAASTTQGSSAAQQTEPGPGTTAASAAARRHSLDAPTTHTPDAASGNFVSPAPGVISLAPVRTQPPSLPPQPPSPQPPSPPSLAASGRLSIGPPSQGGSGTLPPHGVQVPSPRSRRFSLDPSLGGGSSSMSGSGAQAPQQVVLQGQGQGHPSAGGARFPSPPPSRRFASPPPTRSSPLSPPPALDLHSLGLASGSEPVARVSSQLPPGVERRWTLGPTPSHHLTGSPAPAPPPMPAHRSASPNAMRRLSLGPPAQPHMSSPNYRTAPGASILDVRQQGRDTARWDGQRPAASAARQLDTSSSLSFSLPSSGPGSFGGAQAGAGMPASSPYHSMPQPHYTPSPWLSALHAPAPTTAAAPPDVPGYQGMPQQPMSVPAYIYNPVGAAGSAPYAIWQLFNNQWYQLTASGQWLPAASKPPAPAPYTSASYSMSRAVRDIGSYYQRPAAPNTADLAQDVAAQVWQRLQGYMEGAAAAMHSIQAGGSPGGAVTGGMYSAQQHPGALNYISPVLPKSPLPVQAAAMHQRAAVGVAAGAEGVGMAWAGGVAPAAPSMTAVGQPQYYSGPDGKVYCCMDGQWYLVQQ